MLAEAPFQSGQAHVNPMSKVFHSILHCTQKLSIEHKCAFDMTCRKPCSVCKENL